MYDAVVIGLGGVGSFALRSLARRGARVVGLERFEIGHDRGSSHGATRIFRHAYFEHADYVPLCLYSTEEFQRLSDDRLRTHYPDDAVPLLERCGVLVATNRRDDDDDDCVVERSAASARAHGVPVERVDDPKARFGRRVSFPKGARALFEPGAGFVRSESAIRYAIDDAKEHGAEVRERTEATRILSNDDDDDVLVVETADGTVVETAGVVVTVGAWTSRVVPDLAPHLTVTRQIQAWYEHDDDFSPPPMAWFLDDERNELPVYGIPADPLSVHPRRSKVALHGRPEPFDPERSDRPAPSDAELDELRDAIAEWTPGAVDRITHASSCLYTSTPDGHFVVERCNRSASSSRSSDDNVWCVAGLSGHGFKMTPALGRAVADLVLDGQTDLSVDFLRWPRPR